MNRDNKKMIEDLKVLKASFEKNIEFARNQFPQELKGLADETIKVVSEGLKKNDIESINRQIEKLKNAEKGHSHR